MIRNKSERTRSPALKTWNPVSPSGQDSERRAACGGNVETRDLAASLESSLTSRHRREDKRKRTVYTVPGPEVGEPPAST